jgi:hypothetical protein
MTNKELTVGVLRKYEGLENLSNEDAQEAVNAIKKFATILFYSFKMSESNRHETIDLITKCQPMNQLGSRLVTREDSLYSN